MVDCILIGSGHNALVTATCLAKAGRKTLVLERADRIGGGAATLEIVPGFKCSALAHRAALDPAIVAGLSLERHGLRIVKPSALAFAPAGDGRGLTLWADTERATREIAAFSAGDARQYPSFLKSVSRISRVLREVLSAAAPSIDQPGAADLIRLLQTGRKFRALGKSDAYRLLRWLPMAVADLAGEWFESEPLLATVAAGGVLGSLLGPRSAGSAAILLMTGAGEGQPIAPGWTAVGGIGAVAEALAGAAREAGCEIRTGAAVRQILVKDGAAAGVVLENGEELAARTVISGADPRHTLLDLIDPVELSPEFAGRVRNIRMRGALAKVNYALRALPGFTALKGQDEQTQRAALSGVVRIAPSIDDIERAFDRAKYGELSENPWLELAMPSLADPALAPSGHVMSVYVQFAPYRLRQGTWDERRDTLADLATRTIARHVPGFEQLVLGRQVITPLDLERTYGLTGGHIFHGELALDQLLLARPLVGWARYKTPVRDLFLCGSGTHPGTGLDGRSGWLAAREILRQ